MLKAEDISAALARMNPEKRAEAYDLVKEAYARGLVEREVPPFREWLKQISPDFYWHFPHIQLICDELDILEASENGRLILSVPPRHTKTELVTIRYSAYNLLKNPKSRVIIGCYNKDLATKFSGATRAISREAGIEISKDTNAMDEWMTLAGGGLTAVGVGSGVTGRGAEIVTIDDPVKSRAEAESETIRNAVWNWYKDDIFTRLQPNGKIIVIMTRWHADDLVGRILASENAHLWRVVNLPALAEEDNDILGRMKGEALAEEWYSAKRLNEIKKELGIASFTSLYQGKPTPDEGSRFRAEWFKYYREEPDKYLLAINASSWKPVLKQDVRKFQIVDVAATENKRSDYFVVKTYGVTPNRDLLYLDMYREKAETVKHEQIIVSQFNRHRPEWVGIENESYGLALTQTLANSGVPVVKLSADRDKYSRTLTSVSMYEAGRIYHPQGSFWLAENEQELLQFPWGAHDDMVDCDSYAAIKTMDYEKREETDQGEDLLPEEDRTLENIEERNAFFRPHDNSQLEGYEW